MEWFSLTILLLSTHRAALFLGSVTQEKTMFLCVFKNLLKNTFFNKILSAWQFQMWEVGLISCYSCFQFLEGKNFSVVSIFCHDEQLWHEKQQNRAWSELILPSRARKPSDNVYKLWNFVESETETVSSAYTDVPVGIFLMTTLVMSAVLC